MFKELFDAFLTGIGAKRRDTGARFDAGANYELNKPTLQQQVEWGELRIAGDSKITELPANMTLRELDVSDCASLTQLPSGLDCYSLTAVNGLFESIPGDTKVKYRLDLTGNRNLSYLPEGLTVDYLLLRNCSALEALPENLEVFWLDISGCVSLKSLPVEAKVKGRFIARNCSQFTELPPWMRRLSELDVSGWTNLTALPPDLVVSSSIDIANTGITWLPAGCRSARLLWRGVQIDERIAFNPAALSSEEILNEQNVERRRVMMERFGYDKFMTQAKAQVVHRDKDSRGGERKLLKVPMRGDEDLVCVSVICPSTGKNYILRVPPATRTCGEAVAWVCGFDQSDQFKPLMET